MKLLTALLLVIAVAGSVSAQQQETTQRGATSFGESPNLPVEQIGVDDLIGITVYDAPELTRTVRVDSQGGIRLPMVEQPIKASGLYPAELEKAITAALVDNDVLVDPIVTVSVAEYRSRPITVAGAVRSPITFQATGTVTLLDAISRAGGLADDAGAEILVSHQAPKTDDPSAKLVQRISAHALINGQEPALNLTLEAGDEIRVPEAGRVYVLGDVKKPGAFLVTDGSDSSVLKALSLSEGLDSYPAHIAYIYRIEGGSGGRSEIPIELKKIMNRKSPDVPLLANDILYVPNASGAKAGMKVLETSVGAAVVLGAALLYITH